MDHQFSNVDGSGIDTGTVLPSQGQSNFDFQFEESWDSVNGSGFDDGNVFGSLDDQPSDPSNFAPFYNVSSGVDFLDEHEYYPVLKYINQMLMEENMEEQPSMSHDPLALQAAEKSLYEILGKNYPSSPHETLSTALERNAQVPDGSSKDVTNSSDIGDRFTNPWPILDPELSAKQHCLLDNSSGSSLQINSAESLNTPKNSSCRGDGQEGLFTNKNLISSFFNDSETILQFKKGLEEGNKFLPTGNQLIIDLDKHTFSSKLENVEHVTKVKKDEKRRAVNGFRRRKHQIQDISDSDIERSNKHSALNEEEVELSEVFDRLWLYGDSKRLGAYGGVDVEQPCGSSDTLHENRLIHGSNVGNNPEISVGADSGAVDLIAKLISCAQFVAAADFRAAKQQLELIKKHASCTGDQHQRLAVILVNALEARMAVNDADLHVDLTSKWISTSEELKAYRVYLCAPIRQTFSFFSNKLILEAASKARILHIVDFGISFGFQWPSLIQHLSNRAGGPPKLRVTGIGFPKPGFRPAERVEQTGRCLAKYCERFNVPFEYQSIATRNWDKIRIEELKVARDEVLAVTCQFSLQKISDEAVADDCPRDAVLSLIRKMNPDILLNDVLSGQLSSPFFLPRFRDALFFFSTMFDALDNNLPRNDEHRLKFEQRCLGPELLNIVACEGSARVDRCETYKQWQTRYKRAGFRPLPLNQDLMKELKRNVEEGYHKDFMFDEDGCWILQGWKGKIISACSCWVPA